LVGLRGIRRPRRDGADTWREPRISFPNDAGFALVKRFVYDMPEGNERSDVDRLELGWCSEPDLCAIDDGVVTYCLGGWRSAVQVNNVA
jgi:hypothetical protein